MQKIKRRALGKESGASPLGGKAEKEREKGNYLVLRAYATVCSLTSVSSAAGVKARL